MPNRVSFLIDGFNLYHSVKDASRYLKLGGTGTKWLDIRSVCESYLPQIGKNARLEEIHYFSALATHIEKYHPDVTNRHRLFIRCLKNSGVIVHLGRFKSKTFFCPHCSNSILRYEEKETDVAIGAKLLELVVLESCDTVLLMTGDTDLAPAVRTARRISADRKFGFVFPYGRKNKELARLADFSFNLKKQTYLKHQFPDKITVAEGVVITKPKGW